MLADPLVWWGCVGGGVVVGLLGLGWGVMAASGRVRVFAGAGAGAGAGRRRRRGRGVALASVLAGLLTAAAGAGVAWYAAARGPWWEHAPTWVLVRAFPAAAAEGGAAGEPIDPVTAALRERVIHSALSREARQRLARKCAELLGPDQPQHAGARAAVILAELGDARRMATPAVVAALHDPRHREMILRDIVRISDMGPEIRSEMVALLSVREAGGSPAPERATAAWALGMMGPDALPAVSVLATALEERGEAEVVARMAAKALGRVISRGILSGPEQLGAPPMVGADAAAMAADAALSRLAALAEDPEVGPMTRYAAVAALAQIRGNHPGEVATHAALLRSGDPQVRLGAALALRWHESPKQIGAATPQLLVALGDDDERVAEHAHQALRRLVAADERYGDLLWAAAAELDGPRRARVMEVLGVSGAEAGDAAEDEDG